MKGLRILRRLNSQILEKPFFFFGIYLVLTHFKVPCLALLPISAFESLATGLERTFQILCASNKLVRDKVFLHRMIGLHHEAFRGLPSSLLSSNL